MKKTLPKKITIRATRQGCGGVDYEVVSLNNLTEVDCGHRQAKNFRVAEIGYRLTKKEIDYIIEQGNVEVVIKYNS